MLDLYFADLTRWDPATRINGNLLPPNIGIHSATELAEFGLYSPAAAAPIPLGKMSVGTKVAWVDGVMRYVHILEDEPFVPIEVTRAQAEAALFHYRLPDGSDPAYYDQYEELIQNHPYPPVRIWAKGAATWREDHPYVWALALDMNPPINEVELQKLFNAAMTYE